MRTYTAHHVRYRAFRVQEWAFYSAALFGVAFIGFAITDREPQAMAMAILGALAIGVSVGAWIIGYQFREGK